MLSNKMVDFDFLENPTFTTVAVSSLSSPSVVFSIIILIRNIFCTWENEKKIVNKLLSHGFFCQVISGNRHAFLIDFELWEGGA